MDDVYDNFYAIPKTQRERERVAVALEEVSQKFVHNFVQYTGKNEDAT